MVWRNRVEGSPHFAGSVASRVDGRTPPRKSTLQQVGTAVRHYERKSAAIRCRLTHSTEAAPASFAPKQREITCTHEAGHAVVACLLVGGIGGVRINLDGSGIVWRGETPNPDAN